MRHVVQFEGLTLTAADDEALWVLQGIMSAALPTIKLVFKNPKALENGALEALRNVLAGYMAATGLAMCKAEDPDIMAKVLNAPPQLLDRLNATVRHVGKASADQLAISAHALAEEPSDD